MLIASRARSTDLIQRQQLFKFICSAQWNLALRMRSFKKHLYERDDSVHTFNWTILDHAAYQGRIDVLEILKHSFQFSGSVFPEIMTTLAISKQWDAFYYLLDNNFYAINTLDYTGFTLLDQLQYHGYSEVADYLRENYAAKNVKQVQAKSEVASITEKPTEEKVAENSTKQMFIAAEYNKWHEVFSRFERLEIDNKVEFTQTSLSSVKPLILSNEPTGVKLLEPEKDEKISFTVKSTSPFGPIGCKLK